MFFRLSVLYRSLVPHPRPAKTVPGSRTLKSLLRKILSILRTNPAERIGNYSKRLAARHSRNHYVEAMQFRKHVGRGRDSLYNAKSSGFRVFVYRNKCSPRTSTREERTCYFNKCKSSAKGKCRKMTPRKSEYT